SRVAARRLDDRSAGFKVAQTFGAVDHSLPDAILDAAARIERFDLGQHQRFHPARQLVDFDKRSAAYEFENTAFIIHTTSITLLYAQRYPVPQRKQAHEHALIVMQLLIKRAQRDGISVLDARIGDLAAPQHIIKDYEAASTHEFQRALVVIVVVRLVGIDE